MNGSYRQKANMRRSLPRLAVAVVVADLAAAVSPSPAQTAPATAPAAVQAAAAQPASTQAAPAQPASSQPASTQPADDIRLNFKDMPLNTVLEHLSQVAGFVVVTLTSREMYSLFASGART